MKPGDIIVWRDKKFARHRFYEVEGVYLGALGQESVIGLKALGQKPAWVSGIGAVPVCYVPEPLLRDAELFTPSLATLSQEARS